MKKLYKSAVFVAIIIISVGLLSLGILPSSTQAVNSKDLSCPANEITELSFKKTNAEFPILVFSKSISGDIFFANFGVVNKLFVSCGKEYVIKQCQLQSENSGCINELSSLSFRTRAANMCVVQTAAGFEIKSESEKEMSCG